MEYMNDRTNPDKIIHLMTQYNGAEYASLVTHVSHLADTGKVVEAKLGMQNNEKYILFK